MSDIYETISSYIEACAQKSESPHEFIITMLTRDKNENLLEPSLECFLKLCGNNYVHTKIRLQDHNLPSLCTTLVNNSYITGLDLRYNQITDKGAILLANMMKENRFIRELNLRCNDISHDGGVAIADMLHVNQTLLILIMAGNKIGDKAALKFAHSLQINNTLKSLDLGECDMKIDSVIAMATVLNYNHSLKRIILNRPLLWTHQEETTVHMGEMLVRNKGLQALHLEKYDMRDFGVERLCDGFVNNCHLRVLDLGANRMTREGARALAKALERNTTLEVLDVSCNRIHDDGAVALADVLTTTNRQLKVLVVSYNELTDRGLVSLANCLHHNSVLTCLYIWGNEMNEPACDAFHELLSIGRLLEANCDVRSYQVDGRNYLAALSHDCDYRRFRFSVPVYGPEAAMEQWMHQHKAEIVELVRLEEVETLNDPEKEPYRSCYIARDILTTLLKSLEENETSLRSVASNSSTENELDLFIACQVALTLRRAANFNSTEERSEGIMIMESVLQKLATIPLLMQFCDLTIEEPTFNNFNEADKEKLLLIVGLLQQLLNTLGFVYGHVWGHSPENIRKAIHFLTNAKHLYNAYCRSFFVKGVVESDLPLQMIMEEDWSGPEYFMTLFQLDIRNISKEKSHSAPVEEKSVEVVNKEDKNGDAEDEKEVDESVADYEPFKRRQFQDNFTRTLFYLAQAYGKSPEKENKEKSAKYCYFTLHRQLNSMEYEPLEWSLNAATLSQYYHNNDQYLCAKHCLCAAEVILSEAYEDPLIADKYKPPTPDADGNISMEEEKWRQAWADIRRCWIKLGISLLSRSWQFNDQKIYEEVFGKAAPTDGPLVKFVPFNLDLSLVEGQRIPYVSCLLPESTTDKQLFSDVICLKTFDAARKVFLFIQKCIQEAHLFYKLDDQCSDAVALYQDHSLAYKELTHFEFSMERQCCMHKRRVDILRYLIKELNPKCWLMVHRQLIFELAETLNEMMSLKLTMHTEKPSPHLVNKSNTLGLECITAFEGFIETYLDSKGNTPERYPQDDERPVIVAKFHLARLYTRLIEKDKKIRLDRHVKSLEYYKSIVNYCDQYPTAKEQVKQEYDLAVEMCSLLPAKMASMVHAV